MKNTQNTNNLINYIIKNIVEEKWKPDKKIPSIGALKIKFNISKETVVNILNKFIQIQVIYSVERVGYFVKKDIHRSIFKRESKTHGCNSFASIKQNIDKHFNINELKKIKEFKNYMGNWKNNNKRIDFIKFYYNSQQKENIIKISFSTLNKQVLNIKDWDINAPLYYAFLNNYVLPKYRLTKIMLVDDPPQKVKDILKLKNNYCILKYVAIFNEKKEILHAAKIYINPIYFSSFSIYSL